MSSPSATDRPARGGAVRTTVVLLIAAAVAVAVNALVAALAVSAGAPSTYGPLTFPAFTTFTVAGLAAGWAGWIVVRRRARKPRRALAVLVPLVVAVSFVPDVALLILRFIPGTTTAAVVALMAMHLVVAAVAIPAYALAAPVRASDAARTGASGGRVSAARA
ncbi:hypothetical protein CLV46_1903 [Diaminobutyricimonas aerilata]|uniref:Uncharacterized protein n=1 Tax=Diaminobutyricimonas aerilata TaxID=1162967 RepID=A0A2M9CKC8_9MICO|nr:DUF6069 family protein [Diaminobutyricimonas aerilata]PJJ72336.1 hypothetical protein CLV46_1903 [Diaminobutyricimonas aerilata]